MKYRTICILIYVLSFCGIFWFRNGILDIFRPQFHFGVNKTTLSNLKWNKYFIELNDLTVCLALGTTGDQRFFNKSDTPTAIHTYLKNSSLVVEVGGNVGLNSATYAQLYDPFLIILEPIPTLCQLLNTKFETNRKVEIFCYGMGDRNRFEYIELTSHSGDASSIFRNVSGKINSSSVFQVVIKEAAHIVKHILVKTQRKIIDLLSINCEGCEYEIILSLIDSGAVMKFYTNHVIS
jgi:FkbM family methyltransferase